MKKQKLSDRQPIGILIKTPEPLTQDETQKLREAFMQQRMPVFVAPIGPATITPIHSVSPKRARYLRTRK